MREALTSGAQTAFEAELAALARASRSRQQEAEASTAATSGSASAPSVAELREQLMRSLSGGAFEAAHARLQQAALGDGQDDDTLASGEVQRLLGPRHRETLPDLLKLIFLEERIRAVAPW